MNYYKIFMDIKNITKLSFWYPHQHHNDNESADETKQKAKKVKVSNESIPHGYVDIYFEGVTIDELYSVYGLTFTYVKVKDQYYVHTMHVHKSNVTFDCYNDGNNESITIHKENDSKLNIIVTDIKDKLHIKQIINGELIS